ncbi:MAG: DUF6785 family protein, partial [Planctomycetota bacterium]
RRSALSGKELAFIVAMVLPACYVPGRGLMHYFTTALMMPRHYERTDAGWQEQGVVKMLPQVMLAGVSPHFREGDLTDPGGLCLRLVREGEGVVPADGAPGRAAKVWGLLTEDERAGIRAAAEQAGVAPDEGLRADALARIAATIGEDSGPVPAAAADALSAAQPVASGRKEAMGGLAAILNEADLPQAKRDAVLQLVEEALSRHDDACRSALIGPLNGLLALRELRGAAHREGLALPKEAEELLERDEGTAAPVGAGEEEPLPLTEEDHVTLNRHLIDASFPDELRNLQSSRDYAITGFAQGLGEGTDWIDFGDVPWYAWGRTLICFWVPLLLAMSFGVIGLALVVHKQWSTHEHLPYPIIQFASSLLPAEGEARGGVFRNRLFWIGTGAVFALHLNNYAYQWWPQDLVQIPQQFNFTSLRPLLPNLVRGGDNWLLNPKIFFTAVAFAYFVSTEVSLSLGIAPFVYATVAGVFVGYGVSFRGGWYSSSIQFFLHAGAFFGMFLFLAYTGRRWFAQVFRKAIGLTSSDEVGSSAVWGARVFMAGTLVFVVMLMMVGLAWQWAVIYTCGVLIVFIVMSRVVAETGCFFIHPYCLPGTVIAGALGAKVVGPRAMLIMFFVSSILLMDPREAVMPFMVHGLKLIEGRRISLGRTAAWGGAAVAVGLAVAVPVVLYLQYSMGGKATGDGWTLNAVPKSAMNVVVGTKQRLVAQGALSQAGNMGFFEGLRGLSPEWPAVTGFFVAMGLVLAFSVARIRFARWPLHPVMFLILGTWQSRTLGASFLVGWLIKTLVTRYGGATTYLRLKPLMIGIIAGDLFGGILPMIVGTLYYFITGDLPESYRVLPT